MIEKLTFLYMSICLCIIFFNIVFNLYTKMQPRFLRHKKKVLKNILSKQNEDVLKEKLLKKLRHVSYLKVFHEILVEKEVSHIPWHVIGEMMSDLADDYRAQKADKKAYFAYVVYALDLNHNIETNSDQLKKAQAKLSTILKMFLWEEDSLYVRENAFRAIMSIGIEEDAIEALKMMEKSIRPNNQKLIQNHLLNFTGNHQKLADGLYCNLETFTWPIQVAIVYYLRMVPKEQVHHEMYQAGLYQLLCEKTQHEELRLELIHYFNKYYYAPVSRNLVKYVQDKENWELASVAARALEHYEGFEEDKALTQALMSSNWYVRLNAAESLVSKGYTDDQLKERGFDAYDLLTYRQQFEETRDREVV